MSVLADRIRGIVGPRTPAAADPAVPAGERGGEQQGARNPSDLAGVLGGEWRGSCVVIDRRWDRSARHGRDHVGAIGDRLANASEYAPLFAYPNDARAPFLFFDLETTGLSGGAGTHAFLVGCGRFDADGAFVTRQFVMTRYVDEAQFLAAAAAELTSAGALVSFNGKSFDAPLLETRHAFHRVQWTGNRVAHVDALHSARRFWGDQPPRAFHGPDRGVERGVLRSADGCSLTALERRLFGVRRTGDVAGFEVPARYFQFVRHGDARPLVPVLEHNRLDLLTLAALTARLLHLAGNGPDAARDAREAYALGTVFERAGLDAQARACYARAVDMSAAPQGAFDPVRIESQRALARACRRSRDFIEAARWWHELLNTRGCPSAICCEAAEALAIHSEHRARDLFAAKAFALRSMGDDVRPMWTHAVHHRLARLERKLELLSAKPLLPSS